MKKLKAPSYQCKKCPNPNTICWCILADTNLTDKRKIANIKKEVAKKYGISTKDLSTKMRNKKLVEARDLAIQRCRNETNATLEIIGKHFNRSYTSISYAIGKVS